MTDLGLYIHIPFCRSRCDYCGFYSIGRQPDDRFVEALLKEMEMRSPAFAERTCDTLYLGGGTPSSLTEGQLQRVMEGARQYFHISDTAEITMEMNPCDMTESYLEMQRPWASTAFPSASRATTTASFGPSAASTARRTQKRQ